MNLMWFVDKFYNKKPELRKVVSSILFGNKDVDIKLFDLNLCINTLKESGYLRASKMSQQSSLLRDEICIIQNLSALVCNGDSFIDVGANIGVFSSVFSRYKNLYSDFNVFAFEANPDTYKRLETNSKRYGFKCYNYALSDCEGHLNFIEGAVSHVFTTIENASGYHYAATDYHMQTIPSRKLDQFNLISNSLIIKIDVEGQELRVLKGSCSLFDQGKVKAIYLDGFSNQQEVLAFLSSYDFELLDGRSLLPIDKALTGNFFSLLALSRSFL